MDKIEQNPLSCSFMVPVDEVLDQAPGYYKKITHPMDITNCRRKLVDNEYENSVEWTKDLMRIWDNAMEYNKTGFIKECAKLLKAKSEKYTKVIPKTEADIWYVELLRASHRVDKELAKLVHSKRR